jgi:hypothetical protein
MSRRKITKSPREIVNPETAEEALAPELNASGPRALFGPVVGPLARVITGEIGAAAVPEALNRARTSIAQTIPKIKEQKLENRIIRRIKKGR